MTRVLVVRRLGLSGFENDSRGSFPLARNLTSREIVSLRRFVLLRETFRDSRCANGAADVT